MQLDDETLQRYHDGDLTPLEERVVRTRVEQDPDAQQRLHEFEKLGALLRLAGEEMGSQVDSSALFARIEADLEKAPAPGVGERLRVITGEWSRHRRHILWPLAAAAAAAAAAALIVLPAREAGDEETARMAQKREVVRVAETSIAPQVQGTHIENVDFGANTGTVFEVENEGVMTAVVWIADEEEVGP